MQIVIDVDEKLVCEGFERQFTEEERDILIRAIGNGTPLPKGHGDLIDRDKLSHIYRQMSYCSTAPNFIWVSELMKVTPVVEADKSEVD